MPNNKAFTLIEIIIVIAIIGLISAAVFVSVDPAKRLGDAKDAIRASDTVAIEKAIQKAIAEGTVVPVSMAALTEDTPYMMVTNGGDDTGSCNCNTLDQQISRIDIAGSFENYLGTTLPVDSDATGDDTGYYITRKGNSFYVEACNAYGDEYVAGQTCGNGILEGDEVCDSNFTMQCVGAGVLTYYSSGYVEDGVTCNGMYACKNDCTACTNMTSCNTPSPM